jgi:hypothetical protein
MDHVCVVRSCADPLRCPRWYLKLKCTSCGEVPDHFQYITQTEKQPLKGADTSQSDVAIM